MKNIIMNKILISSIFIKVKNLKRNIFNFAILKIIE